MVPLWTVFLRLTARHLKTLVCGHIGALVCGHAGTLVCGYIGTLVCGLIGSLVCRHIGHWSVDIGILVCGYIGHWSVNILGHWSVDILGHWSVDILDTGLGTYWTLVWGHKVSCGHIGHMSVDFRWDLDILDIFVDISWHLDILDTGLWTSRQTQTYHSLFCVCMCVCEWTVRHQTTYPFVPSKIHCTSGQMYPICSTYKIQHGEETRSFVGDTAGHQLHTACYWRWMVTVYLQWIDTIYWQWIDTIYWEWIDTLNWQW